VQNAFACLPPRAGPGLVHVVIDTPRGSRNKYKFDEKLNCLKLGRVLPPGHYFPYDFGSIPGTRGEDGDALDVMLVAEEALFPGCLVIARLIGVFLGRQTEAGKTVRNDRLVAVPEVKGSSLKIRRLDDLDASLLAGIEHFFVSYHQAQGRKFEPIGRLGPDEAEQLLDGAIEKHSA
jgi:inorganic pyrophosphatase